MDGVAHIHTNRADDTDSDLRPFCFRDFPGGDLLNLVGHELLLAVVEVARQHGRQRESRVLEKMVEKERQRLGGLILAETGCAEADLFHGAHRVVILEHALDIGQTGRAFALRRVA